MSPNSENQPSFEQRIAALLATDEAHEERLRRTDERIEALAMNHELLAFDLRDLKTNVAEVTAITKATSETVSQLAAIVQGLATVTANHGRKIEALENNK